MRLQVHHRTEYLYSEPVRESVNEVRLRPRESAWQRCESSFVSVLPPTPLSQYEDLNHNRVHHFEVPEPHSKLIIESRTTVDTQCRVDFKKFPYGHTFRDLEGLEGVEECRPFLQSSHYVDLNPEVWRKAIDLRDEASDVFQTAYTIMEHIHETYEYRSGSTLVSTRSNEVIEKQCGVCQDFAHAMAAYCRILKIPARYVSGYFFDATRDHSLRGSEASHAWVEVYLPNEGWFGFDPTNNKVVDDTYIVVATGQDYRDVAPVIGTYFGAGRSAMGVAVTVRRIDDTRKGKAGPNGSSNVDPGAAGGAAANQGQ